MVSCLGKWLNRSLSYSRLFSIPSGPLSVLLLNVLLFTNQKKKSLLKETFPTDAKSSKPLQCSSPGFLFWLLFLSFFYCSLQSGWQFFLLEAISRTHWWLASEQRELIAIISSSTKDDSQRFLHGMIPKGFPNTKKQKKNLNSAKEDNLKNRSD